MVQVGLLLLFCSIPKLPDVLKVTFTVQGGRDWFSLFPRGILAAWGLLPSSLEQVPA